MPRRAALSAYAGPMPRCVVPICSRPSRRSLARSIATCHGMIRCALPERRSAVGRDAARLERRRSPRPAPAGRRRIPAPMTQILARVEDPGRDVVELERLAADDDRVARVRAALVAADEFGALGEQVDDLALALVAPLRADDHGGGHGWSLELLQADARRSARRRDQSERLCGSTGIVQLAIRRPPGRRTSRSGAGRRASPCRSGRSGAWRR